VVVDRELYGTVGRPRYGSATERDGTGQLEGWFSLVEKAYATWKGSNDVVAKGGSVGQLQNEVLGRPNVEHRLRRRGGGLVAERGLPLRATRRLSMTMKPDVSAPVRG